MSQTYTCITCRVAFADGEIQRQHYKTDWHRYNLKRKVVNLPPVTAEDFQHRVLEQREKDEEVMKDTSIFCKICRKSFSSNKAFENHVNSTKHKEKFINVSLNQNTDNSGNENVNLNDISEPVRPTQKRNSQSNDDMNVEEYDDSDIEEVDSDEWDEDLDEISENNPILKHNCLFCSNHSKTMTKNIKHMSIEHSFFIPDVEYVVDMRGLLLYLGEKVCKFYMCLWCNLSGRGFFSMEAAQAHMRDKGHCKMLHEGKTLMEYETFYNYSLSYPDHDDEMDVDEEIENLDLDGSDFQLTLPSGATIGHRALFQYYKQHFGPNQVVPVKQSKLNRVCASYRALGWKESDKIAVVRKARDIKYMKMVQMKYFTKLGVKANKLQKHFRPQVNF